MKKTLIASSMAAMLMSATAQADVVGLYVGAQLWDSGFTGTFGESSEQTPFTFSDQQHGNYFIALEHPLPLIPNMKIARTVLDTDGRTTLESDFEFNGEVFSADSTIDSTIDLSYVDYTLYYELFDNDLLTFDVGLTARDFDTKFAASLMQADNSIQSAQMPASAIIPMLYASIVVGLPLTGFNLFAEGNFLSFDDHTLYDYQAGVSYELIDNLAVDVNLTIGYRSLNLELQNLDNLYTNIDFDGFFIGAVLHF